MKRFLLFAGSDHYPRGGWHDYKGEFDSYGDACDYLSKIQTDQTDWAHVYDIHCKQLHDIQL